MRVRHRGRVSLAPAALLIAALLAAGCAHAPSFASRAGATTAGAGAEAGAAPPAPSAGAAAGRAPAEPATTSFEWADQLRARLHELRKTEGTTKAGEVLCHWTAYHEGDSLRALTEHIEPPDYPPRDHEYFFAAGELRVFTSSGANALTGPPRERGAYVLAIAFEPGGRVAASRKTVSGAAVAVEEFEATGARGRAEWLIGVIRQASSAKPR